VASIKKYRVKKGEEAKGARGSRKDDYGKISDEREKLPAEKSVNVPRESEP